MEISNTYEVLSAGALYRREKEAGTELGLKAYAYWGKGNLCPDEMTNELMRKATSEIGYTSKILIYNGYPRSISQVAFLDIITNIGVAINIKVDEDVAIKRLLSRGRIDDDMSTIRTRIQVYHKNNEKVLNLYRPDRLIEVNGNNRPQEVVEEVLITLKDRGIVK